MWSYINSSLRTVDQHAPLKEFGDTDPWTHNVENIINHVQLVLSICDEFHKNSPCIQEINVINGFIDRPRNHTQPPCYQPVEVLQTCYIYLLLFVTISFLERLVSEDITSRSRDFSLDVSVLRVHVSVSSRSWRLTVSVLLLNVLWTSHLHFIAQGFSFMDSVLECT